jgi:hypothetical protein
MSIAFLVTALVIVATPGTGALYTIGAGLARGTRASALAAFACTLGTVPHPRLVRRIRQAFAASFVALSARLAVESR